MLLTLCLIGLSLANLNEWNLLVDGQEEWFCGVCATPENWTLIEPSLIVASQWPLNFTLLPKQDFDAQVNLTLFYRLRYCNLSVHWFYDSSALPLDLPPSEEWAIATLLVPGIEKNTSKLEFLTDDCIFMLANISLDGEIFISSDTSSSIASIPPPTSEGSDIILWFLLSIAIALFFVSLILIANYIRRRLAYQTIEMASLEAR